MEIAELKAKLKIATADDFNYLGKDLRLYPKIGFPYFWKTADGTYHYAFTKALTTAEEKEEIRRKLKDQEILVLDPEFSKDNHLSIKTNQS